MHNMQFNALINVHHIFEGDIDLQIVQLDMKKYLVVHACNGHVTIKGLIDQKLYDDLKIHDVFKTRYPKHQVDPYVKVRNVACKHELSGIFCCYIAGTILFAKEMRTDFSTIALINWFKTYLK